jgi:hypothetical protein
VAWACAPWFMEEGALRPASPDDDAYVAAVREAEEVIVEAARRYSPEQRALAFNGGKDCCVVLALLLRLLPAELEDMLVVHFVDAHEFDGGGGLLFAPSLFAHGCTAEVSSFVEATRQRYKLRNLLLVPTNSLKVGGALLSPRLLFPLTASLQEGLVEVQKRHPQIKMFFSGSV